MKIYTLMVFLLTLLISLPAYAYEYEYHATDEINIIHKTTVTIHGNCCPVIFISTKVGHLKNSVCLYEKETQPRNYGLCGPKEVFPLNGARLRDMVGMGYDCATTHVTDSLSHSGDDAYQLIINDNQYTHTIPPTGEIALEIHCPTTPV